MKLQIFLVLFVFAVHSRGEKSPEYLTFVDEDFQDRNSEHVIKRSDHLPKDYEENFSNNEEKHNQLPMRRQISSWRAPNEFSDPNNVPLNIDAYYPKAESSYVQNEYYEDASYSVDLNHKNNSYLELSAENKDDSLRVKHPQYFQKNYYYNYYPLVNGQKFAPPTRSDEGTLSSEDVNKKDVELKFRRRDSCRKYLEFLRYAFNELDESNYKRSDYNEEYSDEQEAQDPQKNRRVFSTHLLGPTLYIDNSGKVSQVNSQGNSIQMIENISPSSILSNSKDVVHPKLTTVVPLVPDIQTETDFPTTFSDLELNSATTITTTTTTERPVLRMDDSDENIPPNSLEPQTQIPEIKNPNLSPKSFGHWSHTLDIYTSRDRFSTTVSTDFRSTDQEPSLNKVGDAKSTPFLENDFLSPHRFSPDNFYRRSDNTMEKETVGAISEKTNSSAGPALYWYVRSSTPIPTVTSSVSSPVNHFQSKTKVNFDNSAELGKEKDCNDKMLPCPDTVNITYPLNGYCNRYVSCESGRAIRRTCPEGLHFNIITKSCDFPHNSFCTYTCPELNGYYGIPGDCSGYFICKNFIPEYRMCPPKMHWDINKSACTFAELSSCPMKCFKPNEIRPFEGDCKAYIICLSGVPYYHKCPPNTKFDSKSNLCIPEIRSECKDDARLLTKTSNPNSLCRDVEVKLGTKVWCKYFLPSENQNSKK